MPTPITYQIPNLGPVIFAISKRAKHLRITIRPDRTVRLTIPSAVSPKKGRQFLHSKTPWIKKHLRKLDELASSETNVRLPQINKTEARVALFGRLGELAELHNFKYGNASIRNQKTRWGSCSGKNNISLNINLIRLPAELRDYVILHELLHTRIKNHSKDFWAELDKRTGCSAKGLRKKLRKHSSLLTLH